jgi:hypothetical protein
MGCDVQQGGALGVRLAMPRNQVGQSRDLIVLSVEWVLDFSGCGA